jgi:predicted glycoside hydrolase/deacetylase ChbG (UPF0249 family)
MNRREVDFIADDFGLSADVNRATIRAHRDGALHGASLMMGQPATGDAVRMARDNPSLRIGWHLHLCDSQPVTRPAWPWDRSWWRAGWLIAYSNQSRRLMRAEIAAQWEQFCRTGLPCAFVNSHHHLHTHPAVYGALLRVLPRDWSGWIRLGAPRFFSETGRTRLVASSEQWFWRRRRRRCPFDASDTLWGVDRLRRMRSAEVEAVMARLPAGRHEFMFHPGLAPGDGDVACLIELRRSGIQDGP